MIKQGDNNGSKRIQKMKRKDLELQTIPQMLNFKEEESEGYNDELGIVIS